MLSDQNLDVRHKVRRRTRATRGNERYRSRLPPRLPAPPCRTVHVASSGIAHVPGQAWTRNRLGPREGGAGRFASSKGQDPVEDVRS